MNQRIFEAVGGPTMRTMIQKKQFLAILLALTCCLSTWAAGGSSKIAADLQATSGDTARVIVTLRPDISPVQARSSGT
jgi:hypothetical protein